ncbi:hypothetical protein H6F90_25715 [Trichocoleus sp. FACHB-591]|uniref:SDH family Clp fold serine proteinase n=1 Tax=Trichocoleus sp. FACHB-591 TaxID=2692872 RepID=UPI0016886B58|nr:hypothetical protein [Trichocoleus sp. FACHB-591]MBD2098473.1 hypothetical protein [Trichocoleus sp. FACHB-591]
MGKAERCQIMQKIQNERNSFVISYVTSTRQGLEVQMAMDSVRKIYEHLRLITTPKSETKIDLFLYSNGGDGTVPWRLVTLIREYTNNFSVLIPHRAFSAATLTALGADKVLMHPMGMLGPTDPTVVNPFNPRDHLNQPLGISVEDVTAYIALVKEDVGIHHEDELVQAFNKLADQVHPLALGNVKRSLSQSRMMAKKLLYLHMDLKKDEHKINEIVDGLTSKLFFHGHPINRNEAKEQIGLPTIEFPSSSLEELMWELYLDYEHEIHMEEPFNPAMEWSTQFPTAQAGHLPVLTTKETAKLVYVESAARTDIYTCDYQIVGQKSPEGIVQATFLLQNGGWSVE